MWLISDIPELADIFNLSSLRSEVPSCFKKTTVIPLPKKSHESLPQRLPPGDSDLCKDDVNSSLPDCLGPLQFADQCNRSTADAISLALQSSLENLDNKDIH
eukprot:g33507.t1